MPDWHRHARAKRAEASRLVAVALAHVVQHRGAMRLCEEAQESLATLRTALAAALLAASAALWHLPRRWRPIGAGVASLAAIELAMGMWKLHHRFIEMKMHDVYDLVHASDQTFQLAMTAAVAAIATLGLRRWWQHTPATRWATVFIVVAASALADSLAIPAAIVGGIATAGALGRCREVVVLAVAAALGIAALGVVDSPVVARVPFELIAPLALALLGIWLGPCRLRARLALVALGLMTTAVRLAGDPALPYRATLIIIGVVALVVGRVERQRDARSLVFLGWAGAIALSMLSRSAQLPGLIAWTAVAALIGRSDEIAQSDERAVITAVLGVIGFRFACFALFEGAFEFSHLEVWLAYQGNPGTAVAFGAAIIAIKFALPLAIGFALVTARLTAAARRTTLLWTGAFFALRIAHIVVGMTVARGTFYSPYLDSGQLLFTYLMGVSAPLVVALLAIVGAWRESAR